MVKMMLVIEIRDVEDESDARAVLDAYRESAVVLAVEFGVTISRATCQDVRESGLLDQVQRFGPVPETFVKPW